MFLCAQAAAKDMVPRKYGKLVLLSSGAARGYRARIHYSAAKAGIESMTRVLAIELGHSNINVNAVAPGFLETRMPNSTRSGCTRITRPSRPRWFRGHPFDALGHPRNRRRSSHSCAATTPVS
jgi:3-oxoacyl-[acyl-carrier protein] reductase